MTQHIKQVNILDMMRMYGEDSCKAVLSTFMCPLNLDVEDFLYNKAIQFARQRILLSRSLFSRKQKAVLLLSGIIPLIAQLGRNFNPSLPLGIAGSDLLSMALQRVIDVEYLIGGKTVYIECNNQPKLFDFYSAAGFFVFDKRSRQGSVDEDDVLVQMLKYFNH